MQVNNLAKAMQLHVKRFNTTTTEETSGLNKWFGDSQELADLYKGKPDQLQAVKERAPKRWHELRQTYLYEDYDLTGSTRTTERDVQEESASANRHIKAKAKPKGKITQKRKHAAAALPEYAGEEKKLKAIEQKRLDHLTTKTQQARANTQAALAEDQAATYLKAFAIYWN